MALRAIVKALLDPKAENIEASRRALQRLANLTATPAAAPRRARSTRAPERTGMDRFERWIALAFAASMVGYAALTYWSFQNL